MNCAHGLKGTQFGAKTTRTNVMFLARRQSLLAQFLKFGVDDHGIIVPILKRGKGHSVRSHSEYRPLQIPLKNPFRSSLAA